MCRLTSTALLALLLLLLLLGACSNSPAPGLATASPTRIGSTAVSHQTALVVAEHSNGFRTALDAQRAGHYGVGTPLSNAEVAGWDIDVRPDGKGLPPGAGTAEIGEPLYEEKCAYCHGVFGEGQERWPKLAGDEPLTGSRPEKTVGNFWPYASTLWDYVHRAMPFFEPQSLSDDQVYALVAYVLYLNDLLENLYPKVSPGGIVAFDEYHDPLWVGASKAIHEFFGEDVEIRESDVLPGKYYLIKE